MKKIIKELLSSSKTKSMSSMRLIVLLGSVSLMMCILYLVFSKDQRLVEALPYLITGLIAFTSGKVIQSKFE